MSPMHHLVALFVLALGSKGSRDERGLSQSTENAILIAGAIAVATIVITAVTSYVRANMPT